MNYEVILRDNANNETKLICDKYSYNDEEKYLNVYYCFKDRVSWQTFAFKDLKYIKITRIEVIKEVTL